MDPFKIIITILFLSFFALWIVVCIWKPEIEWLERAIKKAKSDPYATLIIEVKQGNRWMMVSECMVNERHPEEEPINTALSSDMEIRHTLIFNKGYRD
jgi:hypothetical protein